MRQDDIYDPDLLWTIGQAAKAAVAATGKEPDRVIGRVDDPYLRRWYITRNAGRGSMYLHQFLIGDRDRHLHDHPWDWTTVILAGRYREHRPDGCSDHGPWDVIGPRRAEDLHRIDLLDGPVWTLFITGRRRRDWGFQTDAGWVAADAYRSEKTG